MPTPAPLTKPRRLRPDDVIGIAAPASPVREEYLAAGERAIEELGFRVRRAPHLLARGRYTAGSAEERAADLRAFLEDPEVRAIWAARGGYGSPHLPPLLPVELLRKDPKVLIGASDATALLLWSLRAGIPCLHGPMPAQEVARGRADLDAVAAALTSTDPLGPIEAGAASLRTLHDGRVSGRLTGGCLALVAASLGTPWEIETDGALLFLEDVDTKPYQIDRMLTQLAQAGKLAAAAGVLFGEMPRCRQTEDQGYELDDVLRDLTAGLGVPAVAGLPCGHTEGIHRPLPLGVRATLEAGPEGCGLTIDEPLVA